MQDILDAEVERQIEELLKKYKKVTINNAEDILLKIINIFVTIYNIKDEPSIAIYPDEIEINNDSYRSSNIDQIHNICLELILEHINNYMKKCKTFNQFTNGVIDYIQSQICIEFVPVEFLYEENCCKIKLKVKNYNVWLFDVPDEIYNVVLINNHRRYF